MAQLVLAFAWIFPFSSPWTCSSAPSPVTSSKIHEIHVSSYLVLMQILVIDRAEDILFIIFHAKTFHGGAREKASCVLLTGAWNLHEDVTGICFILREGNMLFKIFLVNIYSVI